jgi:hypothetical protein
MNGERIKLFMMTAVVLVEELILWVQRKRQEGREAGNDDES